MGVTQAPVALADKPDPGDSVLVLSPSLVDETNRTCTELLSLGNPEENRVLWITMHESPQERVNIWEQHCAEQPREAAVIEVGSGTNFDSVTSRPNLGDDSIPLTTVDSPQDLTKLGVEIVDQLERWDSADEQVVFCFHSLSTFMQYNELKKTFKFLHALTAKVSQRGAIAHFHMDSEIHDSQTVSTLLPLFRSVAEYEDGEWTYRSR